MTTQRPRTITETIRTAISESGLSYRAIATATDVQRASIIRFMRGEQSLRLDIADKLAAYFGIECRMKGK